MEMQKNIEHSILRPYQLMTWYMLWVLLCRTQKYFFFFISGILQTCFIWQKLFFGLYAQIYWLQNYFLRRICGSENPKIIEVRPLHPEKVTVWCVLWFEGVIGWVTAKYMSKSDRKLPQKNQCLRGGHLNETSTLRLYNEKEISWKYIWYVFYLSLLLKRRNG